MLSVEATTIRWWILKGREVEDHGFEGHLLKQRRSDGGY